MKKWISHREEFLINNPHLKPVNGDENEELLRWAEEEGLIEFEIFQGEEFYSDFSLETAKIWGEDEFAE